MEGEKFLKQRESLSNGNPNESVVVVKKSCFINESDTENDKKMITIMTMSTIRSSS
jgi:hypothetical protein